MSFKRKEYKINDLSEKAARFFVACKANPGTKVKVTEAMRVRRYSNCESANLTLQMQVRCVIKKIKGEVTLHPEAVAAHLLLALSTAATAARPVLRTITPNQATALVLPVGGVNAGNLQSTERKVRKTSHQEQLDEQNRCKHKAVHAQAHARATTLVAKERVRAKDVCHTTVQVIQQVDGEFRACGYCVSLRVPMIN
jgi:hypothetical protein